MKLLKIFSTVFSARRMAIRSLMETSKSERWRIESVEEKRIYEHRIQTDPAFRDRERARIETMQAARRRHDFINEIADAVERRRQTNKLYRSRHIGEF